MKTEGVKKPVAAGGNIKVLCRFRPFNEKEKQNANEVVVEFDDDEKSLKILKRENAENPNNPEKVPFSFDHIFRLETEQKDVYEKAARPLVDSKL